MGFELVDGATHLQFFAPTNFHVTMAAQRLARMYSDGLCQKFVNLGTEINQ